MLCGCPCVVEDAHDKSQIVPVGSAVPESLKKLL